MNFQDPGGVNTSQLGSKQQHLFFQALQRAIQRLIFAAAGAAEPDEGDTFVLPSDSPKPMIQNLHIQMTISSAGWCAGIDSILLLGAYMRTDNGICRGG